MAGSGADLPPQAHDHGDMLFIYTGGTTGMPKGVMWEQGALWGNMRASANPGGDPPETLADQLANIAAGRGRNRSLVLPPLMHGTGMIIAISTLARGGTVVTVPGDNFDPELAVAHLRPARLRLCRHRRRCLWPAAAARARCRPRQHRDAGGDDLQRHHVVTRNQGRRCSAMRPT